MPEKLFGAKPKAAQTAAEPIAAVVKDAVAAAARAVPSAAPASRDPWMQARPEKTAPRKRWFGKRRGKWLGGER